MLFDLIFFSLFKPLFLGSAVGITYAYMFLIYKRNMLSFFTAFFLSLIRMGALAIVLFYLLPSDLTNFIMISTSFLFSFFAVILKKVYY